MGNIQKIVDNNLCISCGMCVGACGMGCIKLNRIDGSVRPVINTDICTSCGLCERICPGGAVCKDALTDLEVRQRLTGHVKEAYVGWARNEYIHRNAVSGGIVTAIIEKLLKDEIYDAAVGVGIQNSNSYNKMQVFHAFEMAKKYQRSKYFMASYQNVMRFIKKNREKKVIIVGVGCIIDSMKRWMSEVGINSNNYLFIGLLCDRTLSCGIIDYFRCYDIFKKKKLVSFEYRTKEKESYWPGNVKLTYEDRDVIIPAEERYNVCDYFQNERCLYCLNHMNVGADISVGDNYTNRYSNKWGSNSVIVRTDKGADVISILGDELKLNRIGTDIIEKSQGLDKKVDNYKYLRLKKGENTNVSDKVKMQYRKRMHDIKLGRRYYKNPYLYNLYIIFKGKSKIKNRLKLWR